MLSEAGYPNGFETTIYTKSQDNDTATAFQAILAQIGIKAAIETLDSSALAAIQKEDDIDGFIANRGASKMDFTNNYIRLYSSEGIKNHENTYAVAVTQALADEHGLETISDLIDLAPDLVFGAEHVRQLTECNDIVQMKY